MILLLGHTHSHICPKALSLKAVRCTAISFHVRVIKASRHTHPRIIQGQKNTLSCPFQRAFDVGNLDADELFLLTTMNIHPEEHPLEYSTKPLHSSGKKNGGAAVDDLCICPH